jgi:hypothetical protein
MSGGRVVVREQAPKIFGNVASLSALRIRERVGNSRSGD